MRTTEIDEIINLRVLEAFDLQLCVGFRIGRDESRRGNAEHVLRELLFLHQFWTGYAHQLDTDAHEAHIVDIGSDVGAGTGEADPGPESLRLGIDAVTQLRWQVVMDDEFGAHDAVGLGVSPALVTAGLPKAAQLRLKTLNNRIEMRLFIRLEL